MAELAHSRPSPTPANLLRMHVHILRSMAAGEPAQLLAEHLCDLVRQHAPERLASLMRLGADGRVHLLAAPSASPALIAALDGLTPGPCSGSCAAAIHEAAPVLVEDTRCDPRWAEQRALAAVHGIRSCWSLPVQQGDRTLGTFALSGPTPGLPDPATLRLLEQAATIAGSILQLMDLQDAQGEQQETQRRQAERMRRMSGFLAMLVQVNQLAAGRPDTAALYEGICRIAVAQAGLRLAWIGAPDSGAVFHPMAAAGATGFLDAVFVSADPALPEGRGLAGTAWREARTVIRQRFAAEAEVAAWRQAAERFDLGAGAALPLMLRGVPQAVLHIYAAEEGILDAALIALLEELVVDVGRALEAIDQQRHLDRLEALHAALMTQGETLLRAQSDTEMLHWTCAHVVGGALFQVAWIARPDTAGVMQALAFAGPETDWLTKQRFALDETPPSLVARCWLEERTIVSNDMLADPDLARYRALMARSAWRSAAVMPLRRGGALFAVLALGALEANLFTPDVVALCERIAALLGHGLDEFDLKQALEAERRQQFHLARHDALTGLPNRRQFEEHLGRALVGARRRSAPLAICMLDVDDLKPVNDRFGHPAGDALLRQVALRLRDALRRSDLVARLGGDEFALAIDDLGSVGALPELFARVSEAMAAPFDLGVDDGTVRIGLSAGIAVFPEDGEEPDLLLRRADAALYAVKARKAVRACNWQRWDDETGGPATSQPGIDDPYGPEARRLLAATEGIWPVIAAEFVEEFYAVLARQKLAAPILAALSPAELAHLKARQATHLLALMAAATDRDTVRCAARAVGQVHALAGVDNVLMVQALGLYQVHLTRYLATQPLRPSERQNLVTVATARLQEDNAEQMEASARTVAAYFDALLYRPQPTDAPWMDAVQARLDAVAGLPGILSARLLRPDAAGTLQTQASSSTAGLPFGGLNIVASTRPAIDRTRPEGQGLLSEAWHGGAIASTANYQTDPRTAPWHDAARRFGVRSAAALPVRDPDNRPVAVLILFGAFPSQFESMWIRHVCTGLAQELSLLWHRHQGVTAAAVVPEMTAVAWRQRLFAGGLVMHYQPIVDLRTGKLAKVEALARLVLEDGQIIAPGQFIPILGARDLDELFRLGLAEALGQIARWDAEGLSFDVTVNLAPSTLAQPGCVYWVRDALGRTQVAPERLFLEITEDQAFGATDDTSAAATAALVQLGVNLVMDDLGTGYGSLQRLQSLPFRVVKLDQGLVRNVRRSPSRALGFVGALVQLGRDLGISVVVEGLETEDLVEAAVVLGADAGQGFALGRPMPAAAIPGWTQDFVWTVDRKAPRTPLGALATMWRSAQLGGDRHESAEACPVARFLEARGLTDGPLGDAYRTLHALVAEEGRHGPRYQEAVRRFQLDLERMVTDPA
ncbi:MAG TPA: EAL domain-containing protein [Rhodocyclaceae bacterium]|nr:EAL domain-containing protein [Rhodocyclaceae bacterium]